MNFKAAFSADETRYSMIAICLFVTVFLFLCIVGISVFLSIRTGVATTILSDTFIGSFVDIIQSSVAGITGMNVIKSGANAYQNKVMIQNQPVTLPPQNGTMNTDYDC